VVAESPGYDQSRSRVIGQRTAKYDFRQTRSSRTRRTLAIKTHIRVMCSAANHVKREVQTWTMHGSMTYLDVLG
jgi:hypothetical protein